MFKPLIASLAALTLTGFEATPASAGTDEYIGEIMLVGFNFCPRGTTEADGKLLPIASNTALFSLLGTMYGGDGRTTFAVPDLRGRNVVGAGRGTGLSDYRIGEKGGAERILAPSVGVTKGDDAQVDGRPEGGNYNHSPYLAMKYCVVTEGTFPSRR